MVKIEFKQIEAYYPYWTHEYSNIDLFEEYFLMEISERVMSVVEYTDRDGNKRNINPVDHYPALKTYSVWEGAHYQDNVEMPPVYHGDIQARNFQQACHILMAEKYMEAAKLKNDVNEPEGLKCIEWPYDPKHLTYNGNKLYQIQKAAKKIII